MVGNGAVACDEAEDDVELYVVAKPELKVLELKISQIFSFQRRVD